MALLQQTFQKVTSKIRVAMDHGKIKSVAKYYLDTSAGVQYIYVIRIHLDCK